jgi:hypothetical protein
MQVVYYLCGMFFSAFEMLYGLHKNPDFKTPKIENVFFCGTKWKKAYEALLPIQGAILVSYMGSFQQTMP